ncbi:hypothetical protein ZIOFF_061461 [Zingiber officinale]|uniref:Uncharacterized protein n=1 Tax=Zingiber officinale TaxID=94328 RepID=A0A8J5F423_ZINOF|nr:hypothetical protein ZIOFF_061461 [Zingiber officinale]
MSSSAVHPHPCSPPPPAYAPPSCYETFENRLSTFESRLCTFFENRLSTFFESRLCTFFESRLSTFFESRLFLILVGVFVLLGLLLIAIRHLVFGDRDPEFAVSSACVTGFNLSAQQQQLFASFDLNLTVHSPNRWSRIYYENGIASMLYASYILSEKTLAPFDQGTGKTTVIRVRLAVLGKYINSDVVRGIESDRGRGDGAVGFNVRVFAMIRFLSGTRWSPLRVNCNDVLIGFGNGTNEATTGYLLGSAPKKCVVPHDVDACLVHHVQEVPHDDKQPQRVGFIRLGGSKVIVFCDAPHLLHRNNAQAFKLFDVKSTDESTMLLHFVVEVVVRSEGKRLVVNHNHSHGSTTLDLMTSRGGASTREEREKEYIKLGLPINGGINDKFTNVKKVVGVNTNSLAKTCASLDARLTEIK